MKNSGIVEELMSEQPDGSFVFDKRQINLLLNIYNFRFLIMELFIFN